MALAKKSRISKPATQITGTTAEDSAARVEEFRNRNRTYFYEPFPWQTRLIEAPRTKSIIAAVSSNKIGKTTTVVNILISWVLGFEPWTMRKDCPGEGWIQEGGYWFRVSSLGHKPPVDLILTGEDWKTHIGGTLVPELKKWSPMGMYQTKCNEQGVEYLWNWANGSTLKIMCYTQSDDLFESFRVQGVIMDEPPPKSKYTAMSRGLLLDGGKVLLSLTPLKEAWILDEIVLSGRKDIAIIDGLKITDNPQLYDSDMNVLQSMGLRSEQAAQYFNLVLYSDFAKQLPVIDKGSAAEKYLESITAPDQWDKIGQLKILKFIKDIDPDDVPPRVFGQFKSLVGRVLKQFDANIHRIKAFEVPTDWPVTVMIDFHLSTPQAVSYWAVDPHNIHYCVAETWDNLSADGIADDIIKKRKTQSLRIVHCYIDPLSKGDTQYMRNALGTDIRDTFSILDERLAQIGVYLDVASKDKDSGIKNIQSWLKGPNGLPTCYIFENCERHLFEVQRWVFDDDGKPQKENDHFMENWYRYTLTGAKYVAPRNEYNDRLKMNHHVAPSPLYHGLMVAT